MIRNYIALAALFGATLAGCGTTQLERATTTGAAGAGIGAGVGAITGPGVGATAAIGGGTGFLIGALSSEPIGPVYPPQLTPPFTNPAGSGVTVVHEGPVGTTPPPVESAPQPPPAETVPPLPHNILDCSQHFNSTNCPRSGIPGVE